MRRHLSASRSFADRDPFVSNASHRVAKLPTGFLHDQAWEEWILILEGWGSSSPDAGA